MSTPAELLQQSLTALRNAKRFSAASQSYRKDNPAEYAKVIAYLDGGARPSGVTTEMGKHALLEEDARRASLPPDPPDPDPGTVIWNGDLSTGNESQFTAVVEYTSNRFQVLTQDAGVSPRTGYTYMARAECRQGEPTNWSSALSATFAIKAGLPVGRGTANPDTYMGWSAWIPSDWPWADASMHSTFVEWHGDGSMSQAPFHWAILGNGSKAGWFSVDLHRAVSGYSPVFQVATEPLSTPGLANAWHDYTLRILWANDSSGRFTFWRDGNQQYDYTGPTAPLSGEGLKAQLGPYCKNAPPASKRMYLSAMRIGTTYDSVQP